MRTRTLGAALGVALGATVAAVPAAQAAGNAATKPAASAASAQALKALDARWNARAAAYKARLKTANVLEENGWPVEAAYYRAG
jgi:hypothetical protein